MGLPAADQCEWNAVQVAFLKAGVAAGVPAAVTATALGITRNAVLGKTNRLGLSTPKPPQLWTAAEDTYFKERWEFDAPEKIATELGRTAGAVRRRAHRLGLPSRRTKPDRGSDGQTAQRIRTKAKAKGKGALNGIRSKLQQDAAPRPSPLPPPMALSAGTIPKAQRRTFAELTDRSCRYPFGDPQDKGFFFCGDDALPGKPYCGSHFKLCCPGMRR